MAVRSSAAEQLKFSLEILRRIPRQGLKTARDIHSELESAGWDKSLRTIQRTLNELVTEFDIHCDDRSKPFGYRWNNNAKGFALADLSLQESLMLRLSEEYLKGLLPPNLLKSMDSFFEHSRNRLLDPTEEGVTLEQQWLDKVQIISERQALIPPDIDPTIFETITQALYENCYLDLCYQNAQGKVSNARVMPLGLVQQGVRFYVACRYDNGEDYSLAVHRIKAAKAMSLHFDAPDDFKLQKYVNKGRFNYGDGELVVVKFTLTKSAGMHLAETPLSKDQSITEVDENHIEIKATIVDSQLIDKFVHSFGKALKSYEKTYLQSE